MKNVRSMVLATITMLFMGMANLNAQEKEPQTVIIRTFEIYLGKSKMYITLPNGENQIIELNRPRGEGILYNDDILQSQINNWKKQGFKIEGMTSHGIGDSAVSIIVILTKN